MTRITIDIETVPSQKPGAREEIRASIKPPGTLKKAESIAAWWATDSAAAVEAEYRRQSLDGGLHGEIISIALVANDLDDDAGWVHCRAQGESEADLLERFGAAVVERLDRDAAKSSGGEYNFSTDPFFICHNAAFDLPYIWRRCIVNNVRLLFKVPAPSARAGKDFGDTMTMWAGFNGRVSLGALCRALSVSSSKDGGIDGAGVYDAWLAGEYECIAEYNLRDVIATAAVCHRLQGGAA